MECVDLLLSDWAVHWANVLSWSKAESSVAYKDVVHLFKIKINMVVMMCILASVPFALFLFFSITFWFLILMCIHYSILLILC